MTKKKACRNIRYALPATVIKGGGGSKLLLELQLVAAVARAAAVAALLKCHNCPIYLGL